MEWTYEKAREALKEGPLPAGFDAWELRPGGGWSIAHLTAQRGWLPAGFTQWSIATASGYTVAHAAAGTRRFLSIVPRSVWLLKDRDGKSVWDTARDAGHVKGDIPPRSMPTITPGSFGPSVPLF